MRLTLTDRQQRQKQTDCRDWQTDRQQTLKQVDRQRVLKKTYNGDWLIQTGSSY